MSRQSVRFLMLLILMPLCVLVAQPTCSMQTVAGTWAAASTGTVFASVPGSENPMAIPGEALGILSIGYDGRISATLTGVSRTGQVADIGLNATLTVNPDCTGTLSGMGGPGWIFHEQVRILDDGTEIWTIADAGMMNMPAVWQCKWKKIAPVPLDMIGGVLNCSADMLVGTWVGSFEGLVFQPGQANAVPFGISTVGGISYQRRMAGKVISSAAGEVGYSDLVGSVSEVKPDCTGTWKWTLRRSGTTGLAGDIVEKLVLLNGGNEMWTLTLKGANGIPVGIGRYRKTSPVSAY